MIRTIRQHGFSLIELAVVLFIISLILGGLLPPLATQIEQKEREQTQAQLDEIKQVLYGYAFKNNYLPCPDCRDNSGNCAGVTANDGFEDTIAGTGNTLDCASEVGNLPWASLGVQEYDAWNQHFTYRVDNEFADRESSTNPVTASEWEGTGCTPTTSGVSFSLCSDGNITVKDSAGGSDIADNVPAIVVSHGADWSSTATDDGNAATYADEDENYDDGRTGDTAKTFVYKDFVKDNTDSSKDFDDMMIWISPHVFRAKMLEAGILP